jgi:hypothetical protein
MKTCTIEGCDRKHRARGLCGSHYNQTHAKDRHAPKMVPCFICDKMTMKSSGGSKTRASVCSNECRKVLTFGTPLPKNHWARWWGKSSEWTTPQSKQSNRRFIGCTCAWCGDSFMACVYGNSIVPRFCADRCSHRYHESKRGRSGLWISPITRRAIYERDGWMCQLCDRPVDKTLHYSDHWAPSLDHIVPRSTQLVPDHSESNLRLAHRHCNSLRGDKDRDVRLLVAA